MTRPKRYAVVIESKAATDIAGYARWIAEQGSPMNAIRWVSDIEDAIMALDQFPERCPVAPESDAFDRVIRQLIFKSHRILFTVGTNQVHVLHVRHGAQLPLA